MKQIKVFLDSSVIFAGLAFSKGGSFQVLLLIEAGIIIPYVSGQVVTEVTQNAQRKLPEVADAFYALFKVLKFNLIDPTENNLLYAKKLINEKDAGILAAAITAEVDWLLSLDKHFLRSRWKNVVDFSVGTPGDFLQKCP